MWTIVNHQVGGSDDLPALVPLSPFQTGAGEGLYWSQKNCCGLVAAYHVLHEQGCSMELDPLSRSLKFGEGGTSMASLASLFQNQGLKAQALELSVEQLVEHLKQNPRSSCIVHTKENHWMAAAIGDKGDLQVFDYPRWYSIPTRVFSKTYDNRALFVSRDRGLFHLTESLGHLCTVGSVMFGGFFWLSLRKSNSHREASRLTDSDGYGLSERAI